MGIEVAPPDVNRSHPRIRRDRRKMRLDSRPSKAAAEMRRTRSSAQRSGGPIRSLFDFCQRIDPATCNRAGHRKPDQSRGVRQPRRQGVRPYGIRWIGHCKQVRRHWRIAGRAKKVCSAISKMKTTRAPAPPACPICPNGTNGKSLPTKEKCSAFISPAIRWPSMPRNSDLHDARHDGYPHVRIAAK